MAMSKARAGLAALAGAALLLGAPSGRAADVGGWFADQQRAHAQAAATADADACPQVIARAASDTTAAGAYHAALCYLQAEAPDMVAAKAWLARAAELNHLPAHRMLRTLQLAEASPHGPARHCHNLGEGRQICHGGMAGQPAVATAPN